MAVPRPCGVSGSDGAVPFDRRFTCRAPTPQTPARRPASRAENRAPLPPAPRPPPPKSPPGEPSVQAKQTPSAPPPPAVTASEHTEPPGAPRRGGRSETESHRPPGEAQQQPPPYRRKTAGPQRGLRSLLAGQHSQNAGLPRRPRRLCCRPQEKSRGGGGGGALSWPRPTGEKMCIALPWPVFPATFPVPPDSQPG